jgi:hypothetical protein
MAKHVGSEIDGAAPVTRTGGTKANIGGAVGGAIGAAIGGKGGGATSDVDIPQYAWLGVGPTHFVLTKASGMGKPTGEPLATIAYADVAACELTEGKLTLRVDLDVDDGRHVAFEMNRQGINKQHVPVLEALRDRCLVA